MRRNIALSRSYREDNLEGFRARYVFATSDGKVGTTARFENGDMKVFEEAADDFTVRVRFKDAAALRRFLFAENQDVLKSYSDALMHDPTTESGIFAKLHTLFNAGIGPEVMNGYYPGALVSWLSQGILGAFDINSLNLTWKATRSFSPWTGKRFDPIDKARLAELTDGHERGDVPTLLCSNLAKPPAARSRMTGRCGASSRTAYVGRSRTNTCETGNETIGGINHSGWTASGQFA